MPDTLTTPTPEAHALAYLHAHLPITTCNTAPAFLERIAQVMVQYAAELRLHRRPGDTGSLLLPCTPQQED